MRPEAATAPDPPAGTAPSMDIVPGSNSAGSRATGSRGRGAAGFSETAVIGSGLLRDVLGERERHVVSAEAERVVQHRHRPRAAGPGRERARLRGVVDGQLVVEVLQVDGRGRGPVPPGE